MFYYKLLQALAMSSIFIDVAHSQPNGRSWTRQILSPRQDAETCLDPDLIQSASAANGQGQGVAGVKDGQSESET